MKVPHHDHDHSQNQQNDHKHPHSHSHSHSHDHGHHHHGADQATVQSRIFKWGIGLNLLYVAIELFYGFKINSLALIADAVHNFGDVCGLLLAWLGFVLLSQKPTVKMTFGLKKFSILAAFINSLFLILSSFWVIKEAIERFNATQELPGVVMMVVATVGVVINFTTALLFHKNSENDLNMKAAFLHLMADAAVSAGVIIAGLVIYFNGPVWIDPVSSVLIAVVVLVTTWSVFKESFLLMLDGVPQKIKADEVRSFLLKQKGIAEVHNLHIWAVSASETIMTAHLVMPGGYPDDEYLAFLRHEMVHHFSIHKTTFQIEKNSQNCD